MTSSTSSRPHRLVVTPRDIEILRSLCDVRYLTAQALEWLHWPSWRGRWAAWHHHHAAHSNETKEYLPSTRVYTRLSQLANADLITRIYRPITLAVKKFGRDADLYALTRQGADLLVEAGRAPDDIVVDDGRLRSSQTLAHSADVGRVYAALRACIEDRAADGLSMTDWQGDHHTARAYDRVDTTIQQANGTRRKVTLPVQPDGTFTLMYPGGSLRCFVEVDRGRHIRTWREKIHAYRAYRHSPQLQARYGVATFALLTVTNVPGQRTKLMQATAQILGRPSDYYLFTLISEAHPTRIGQWLKITEVPTYTTSSGRFGASPPQIAIKTDVHYFL